MAGETTSTTALHPPYELPAGPGFIPMPTLSLATGQLELADVQELGYLPIGTVYGFMVKMTDMDTNVSPLVSHKLTLGSTDLITGITLGQAGGNQVYVCTPTTITAKTVLKLINTAAAATAQAGTVYVTALMQK